MVSFFCFLKEKILRVGPYLSKMHPKASAYKKTVNFNVELICFQFSFQHSFSLDVVTKTLTQQLQLKIQLQLKSRNNQIYS